MTLKNDWDPSIYNYLAGASDLRLQQFPQTPIDATDSVYDVETNICAHKSDCDKEFVDSNASSDASSTSSGVRRRAFPSRT